MNGRGTSQRGFSNLLLCFIHFFACHRVCCNIPHDSLPPLHFNTQDASTLTFFIDPKHFLPGISKWVCFIWLVGLWRGRRRYQGRVRRRAGCNGKIIGRRRRRTLWSRCWLVLCAHPFGAKVHGSARHICCATTWWFQEVCGVAGSS